MAISKALLEDLAKCFGAPIGTVVIDGEEIPVLRPAWKQDENIETQEEEASSEE